MASRRFWHGNESHSWNLGVNRTGGVIDHASSPPPSLPSQEQRAYASYVAMSRRLGAPIMPFEKWYAKDSGIGSSLFSNYLQFHGMTVADVGRQDFSILKRGVTVRPEYNGSWDNAVRALEG